MPKRSDKVHRQKQMKIIKVEYRVVQGDINKSRTLRQGNRKGHHRSKNKKTDSILKDQQLVLKEQRLKTEKHLPLTSKTCKLFRLSRLDQPS